MEKNVFMDSGLKYKYKLFHGLRILIWSFLAVFLINNANIHLPFYQKA